MSEKITAAGRYFLIPVKNGAPKTMIRLLDDAGEQVGYFDIELGSAGDHDFLACGVVPVAAGEPLSVETSSGPAPALTFTDDYPAAPDAYRSPERLQYHFSSRRGWLNDPNGLFYFDGEYHLFYQHNPYGTGWGNMHWGHAVSPDLLHWQERADVLAPDRLGTMFSGSAVVDTDNTSGLGDGVTPPVLLFYTASGADCTQCLAYSTDGGGTFRKYAGNPVIPTVKDARDPNIIWHAPSQRWIMALYLGDQADHAFAFYKSADLLHWEMTAQKPFRMLPERECPGFFALPVEGEPGLEKYIFTGANGLYWIGAFDGERFTPEKGPQRLFIRSGSNCAYAGQSWFNSADGRQLYLAWQTGFSASPFFNQSMAMPVEVRLKRFSDGLALTAEPIRELASLHGWSREFAEIVVDNAGIAQMWEGIPKGDCWDIEFEVAPGSQLTVTVCENDLALDAVRRTIRFGACEIALPEDAAFKVRILVDRNSYEIFAADGRAWLCKRQINRPDHPLLFTDQSCGKGVLKQVRIRQVQSVWQ